MGPTDKYTDTETEIVVAGVLRGDTHKKILDLLPGRDPAGLRVKIYMLRKSGALPPAPKKTATNKYRTRANERETPLKPRSENAVEAVRKCLSCLGMFRSEWIGNRTCIRCKHVRQNVDDSRYALRLE